MSLTKAEKEYGEELENAMGLNASDSSGMGQWTIVLRSGSKISIDSTWNGTNNGPAQLVIDHRKYMNDRSKPSFQRAYTFRKKGYGNATRAIVSVDIADVEAIAFEAI